MTETELIHQGWKPPHKPPKEGDELRCPNGHLIGHWTEDMQVYDVVKARHVKPVKGTNLQDGQPTTCHECGANWLGQYLVPVSSRL